ncbi:MAG: SGNH/GDSL hydrolase family protein [Luteolibacter sp.]
MSTFARLRATLIRLKNHQSCGELALSDYPLDPLPDFRPEPLQKGDHLAICGDSLTEQRLYSVLIETYLAACRPDLEISVRQFGWSGEKAGEFLRRQHADVLRFRPTIATVLYGMNDSRYMPYAPEIAGEFRENLAAILQNFHAAGCRILLGSPTIIGAVPDWVKTARGSRHDLNLTLCRLRNVAGHLAQDLRISFADHFRAMLEAHFDATSRFGPDFRIAGQDGVHPDWAGQAIIGYGFLVKLGLVRELAAFTLNATTGEAAASEGHQILSNSSCHLHLRSTRFPFDPGNGPPDDSNSLRAGLDLTNFPTELNRFTFRIIAPQATAYEVMWGTETRRFSAERLTTGISLAEAFPSHPLTSAFHQIWTAVAAKQAYETRQHKEFLTAPDGSPERETAFTMTESTLSRYISAIASARKAIDHEITITPWNAEDHLGS